MICVSVNSAELRLVVYVESLSDKLKRTLKNLRGEGVLTKEHVDAALREIRLALLEADVNYKVAKDFIASVKEKAEGQQVWQELKPSEQVVKIVFDELVQLLAGKVRGWSLPDRFRTWS